MLKQSHIAMVQNINNSARNSLNTEENERLNKIDDIEKGTGTQGQAKKILPKIYELDKSMGIHKIAKRETSKGHR